MGTNTAKRPTDDDSAESLVGLFRTFGEYGSAYEVLKIESPTHALIRVLESGEELKYRISEIRTDPRA